MTMNLGFSETQERFRQEVRSWMDENCVRDPMPESLDDQVEYQRRWQRSLADAHLVGVHWPIEWGGRGLSLIDNYIVQEEMALADAPEILNRVGVNLAGPVLLQWGTPAQKESYLRRSLVSAIERTRRGLGPWFDENEGDQSPWGVANLGTEDLDELWPLRGLRRAPRAHE
jgi:alkylation response protein AidB-like acyl-CoA dehydrogenase